MRRSIVNTLLACTAAVHAFSDSSAFILLSSSNLPAPKSTSQLQTTYDVSFSVYDLLSSCPTSRYVLVSQPGIHAGDIRPVGASSSCGMPNLCRAVDRTSSHYSVAEVIGQLATNELHAKISSYCTNQGRDVTIDKVELKRLPGVAEINQRRSVLADNDYELGQLLDTLSEDYTVLLFSDPNEFHAYEPSFVEPVHMDLKRQADVLDLGIRAANTTWTPGLFEKYQFFTPGIFMGLIALIVMLSILSVGLRALSSLQVSYGAFEKDMGPAAQKKQM